MEFKNLILVRDQIIPILEELMDELGGALTVAVQTDNKAQYSLSLDGQKKALLIAHFKKAGTTTLQTSSGQNTDLSELAANRVLERCGLSEVPPGLLVLPNLNAATREEIFTYLVPDFCQVEENKGIQAGEFWKLKGVQGDQISFTHYDNGKVMVQGAQGLLMSEVVSTFLAFVEDKLSVLEAQLKSLKVDVSADDIVDETRARLPRSYEYLGETLISIISPSVCLMRLDIKLTDYTCYVMPALRGLEGYMKKLCSDNGVHVGSGGFKGIIEQGTLSVAARGQINCNDTCTSLNQGYAFLSNQRHGLFHVDGAIVTTRLIDSKDEAVDLINQTLTLIDETYSCIP